METRRFQVLAVNPYDDRETVSATRDELGLSFQMLMDPDHVVEADYGVFIYPTNFIVDGSGKIRYRLQEITEEELRSYLEIIYGP